MVEHGDAIHDFGRQLRRRPREWYSDDILDSGRQVRLVRFWNGSGILEVRAIGETRSSRTRHLSLTRRELAGPALSRRIAQALAN